jgi:phage pi2 protein 07
MGERLTNAEIQSRFDSEYVILADPETDDNLEVLAGTVVHHGKDHGEAWRKAAELKLQRSAVLYTGKLPEDIVFVF